MIADFSQHISLSLSEKKVYIFLRFFVVIVFAVVGFYFSMAILFPTLHFQHDSSIDSLANTITTPEIHEDGTVFYASHAAESDVAHIIITVEKNGSLPPETQVAIKKSYSAFFAPLAIPKELEITTDLPYPSATLLKSSQGIFVIDKETIRAFDTIETFSAAGYSFDDVITSTSDERSAYTKAKIFAMDGTHPLGTVFHATDTDKYFLYQNGTIMRTSVPDTPVITVAEDSRDQSATCTLDKSLFSSIKYSCTIDLTQIKNYPGKDYQIILNNVPNANIAKIKVSFSAALSRDNFRDRLTSFSGALDKKY